MTHFSLDSWGQIEQKTTPLTPKVTNQSQNPFNPFTTTTTESNSIAQSLEEKDKPAARIGIEEEESKNTNPFIDCNPFLGLLNPFKEEQSLIPERKDEPEKEVERGGARIVKTEEIQTTTTTVAHKVQSWLMLLAIYEQHCLFLFCTSFIRFIYFFSLPPSPGVVLYLYHRNTRIYHSLDQQKNMLTNLFSRC